MLTSISAYLAWKLNNFNSLFVPSIIKFILALIFFFVPLAMMAGTVYASHIQFVLTANGSFVSGQFTCTEVNQYGSLIYACGGKGSDGSIKGIRANQKITLPDDYLKPYHDPKKLDIKSVSLISFIGEISKSGETMVWCQFPQGEITTNSNATILVDANGLCRVIWE